MSVERGELKREGSPAECWLEAHLVIRNRNPLKLHQVKKWTVGVVRVLVIESKDKPQRTAPPISYWTWNV